MKFLSQLLLGVLCTSILFPACKKVQEASKSTQNTNNATDPDALVATPAGLIRFSHIHFIERGNALMRQGGHVYKVERASQNKIEDLGVDKPAKSGSGNSGFAATSIDEDNSWITDAHAQNTSSNLITSFSADWVVPNLPTSNDNQLLYIFNGLASVPGGLDIMQPVLQYGSGPAGPTNGGWAVANWYVWIGSDDEAYAAITPLDPVSPNTILRGILTYTGQVTNGGAYNGSYNYTSTFTNLTTGQALNNPLTIVADNVVNGGAVIPVVPPQTTAYVALEAWTTGTSTGYSPGVVRASDYPAGQNYVDMYNAVINVDGTPTFLGWTAENLNTPFGENTQTSPSVNNSTNGGSAIYIYWHPIPTINGSTSIRLPSTSTSYPITGYPGTKVNVILTGQALILRGKGNLSITGTTTSTLTITTPGVTFNTGSNTISVTNSSSTFSVIMPASGSINVTASYTTTVPPPPPVVDVAVLAIVY